MLDTSQEKKPSSPFPTMEEEVTAYWKKHRIFEHSIEERPEKNNYTFYDGPPFATGLPHYGHLLQSTLKDVIPRYWTMKGFRVRRRWGWDCHGLPIENLIEKKLGLRSKREIEAYGIEAFNQACRNSVLSYEKDWAKYVERLGRWVDFEHSYKTMDNDYIESVWWAFSELWRKGYLYKDLRVSLYCPRCATPLSNFEIAMGNFYTDTQDPAVFVKFPIIGEKKTFFVAWTTTPWSIPAVTGLAVHADFIYVAVKLDETEETLIFVESRQEEVLRQYYPLHSSGVPFQVVGRWKGSELVGKRFEPTYRFLPTEGDAYRVITGEHVTQDVGTGIVTTAPAFGEEDLMAARQYGLPVIITLDEEGKMISECGSFAGLKAKDANPLILQDLQLRGLLYREETITHSVPICWRCNTLLIYKAQSAWFVSIQKLRPELLRTAKKIDWRPEHIKEGRFGKGLETAPDWNFSRTRYWGSPLPVWECDQCKERIIIGSVAELLEHALSETLPESLDLHRPCIDRVVLRCSCGGESHRTPEVFDCWFESGSMPYAALHYPFENKRVFEQQAPADFIGEAQDQTRGWFYTLHVLSTALFRKPAFLHVVVTGLVLAEDGKKMSKSLNNYPDPWMVLTTYGADSLRYYLLTSPVVEADSMNFSEGNLRSVMRGFINLLWNVKAFFVTYAVTDAALGKPRSAHVLDRWIFARLMQLLDQVTRAMDNYEVAQAARPLREFVDDLSTWWLRRSRGRMKSDNLYERMDASRTLREVLLETAKIIAPFTPFLAEKIYLDVGGQNTSVHLERWSKVETRLIDERLLDDIRWIREVVSLGHEARAVAHLPVRQTLAQATIVFAKVDEVERWRSFSDLLDLAREEWNVERIVLAHDASLSCPCSVSVDTNLTDDLRDKGWRREFARHIMSLRKQAGLQSQESATFVCRLDDGQERSAIQQRNEELKNELKTSTMMFAEQAPAEFRLHADIKVGSAEGELWLAV